MTLSISRITSGSRVVWFSAIRIPKWRVGYCRQDCEEDGKQKPQIDVSQCSSHRAIGVEVSSDVARRHVMYITFLNLCFVYYARKDDPRLLYDTA